MSQNVDGQYVRDSRRLAYEGYSKEGGIKGSLIMGGPDAFDVSSTKGLAGMMGSFLSESKAPKLSPKS